LSGTIVNGSNDEFRAKQPTTNVHLRIELADSREPRVERGENEE